MSIVGTFERMGGFAFVNPDDQRVHKDVFVPSEDFGGAEDGDKVVVEIVEYTDPKASPRGRVAEVIGSRVGIPTEIGDPLGQMKLSTKAKAQGVRSDATALLTACGLALRSFD